MELNSNQNEQSNKTETQNNTLKKGIILSIILVIVIVVEVFIRQPLFDESVKFEERIHEEYPDKDSSLYSFAKFLSFLPKSIILGVAFLLCYLFCNIQKSFVMIMSIYFYLMLNGLLKLIYHNPRPIWESNKIMTVSCEGGFGNPSGHSLGGMILFLSIYEIFVNHNSLFYSKDDLDYMLQEDSAKSMIGQSNIEPKQVPSLSQPPTSWHNILRISFLVFFIILIPMIAMSRIVLGVHSFNQILYGMSLGLIFYYFFYHIVFTDLNCYRTLQRLVSTKAFYYIGFSCAAVVFGVSMLLYNTIQDEEMKEKYEAIIHKKCPDKEESRILYNEALLSIVVSMTSVGVLFGLFIDYFIMNNNDESSWVEKYFGYSLSDRAYESAKRKASKKEAEESSIKDSVSPKSEDSHLMVNESKKDKENEQEHGSDIVKNENALGVSNNQDNINNIENHRENNNMKISIGGGDIVSKSLIDQYQGRFLVLANEELWSNTVWWKTLLRIIVILIVCVVLAIPTLTISSDASLGIVLGFKYFVPLFLIQVYLFGFNERVCCWMNLTNKRSSSEEDKNSKDLL